METKKGLRAFWRRRSLKFWLTTGMLMTSLPIFVAAITGYLLYHQQIIQPLVQVASQQRHVLQPLQSLQLSLWDVSRSVLDYAVDGDNALVDAYRQDAATIDRDFAGLVPAAGDRDPEARDIAAAQDAWRELTTLSGAIFNAEPLRDEPQYSTRIEAFDADVDRLAQRLEAVYDDLRAENEASHDQALADLALAEDLAMGGFVASIAFAVLGVYVINRSLVSSMSRLASGAMRVAAGDRHTPVDVEIPHELASVADTFNRMTSKILEQEEAVVRAARTDGLTGLLNRREFDRLLGEEGEEIRRSDRYGAALSLVMADLDHFKQLNDTHGHQAGDEVLVAVAETLRESVRDVDRVCRFGGEEFTVLLPDSDAEAARRTAERIRAAVEARAVEIGPQQTVNVTLSLGFVTYPAGGSTPDALLKGADTAMYRSKEEGRNRVTG